MVKSKLGVLMMALIAVVSVLSATMVTALVIDGIGVMPDNPLYPLERLGEGLRLLIDPKEFNVQLALERAGEFGAMAEQGKAESYLGLVVAVQDRLDSAVVGLGPGLELQVIENAMCTHVTVMDNVYGEVSENAKTSIVLAMSRTARDLEVVNEVKIGTCPPQTAYVKLENIRVNCEGARLQLQNSTDANLELSILNNESTALDGIMSNVSLTASAGTKNAVQQAIARVNTRIVEVENKLRPPGGM